MKNKYIEQVYNDYSEHQEKLQDNYYSSIYFLAEILEDNWNGCGANLKYDIDIKDDYLYIENTKICPMDELLCCSSEADTIKYKLKGNKYLAIVIQWIDGNDAFINQIYIQSENDEDNFKILYEREEQATEDLKNNVDLKYVYLKDNGNLSYCKTKKEDQELLSIVQFNLMIDKVNWNVEFIVLKEGIYKLTEDEYCKQYKKVS